MTFVAVVVCVKPTPVRLLAAFVCGNVSGPAPSKHMVITRNVIIWKQRAVTTQQVLDTDEEGHLRHNTAKVVHGDRKEGGRGIRR